MNLRELAELVEQARRTINPNAPVMVRDPESGAWRQLGVDDIGIPEHMVLSVHPRGRL